MAKVWRLYKSKARKTGRSLWLKRASLHKKGQLCACQTHTFFDDGVLRSQVHLIWPWRVPRSDWLGLGPRPRIHFTCPRPRLKKSKPRKVLSKLPGGTPHVSSESSSSSSAKWSPSLLSLLWVCLKGEMQICKAKEDYLLPLTVWVEDMDEVGCTLGVPMRCTRGRDGAH